MAVAALGSVASVAFASVAGANLPGIEFGARMTAALDPQSESLRIAASNHAFQAIAAIAATMCLLAALIAWFTQPSWQHARGVAVAAAVSKA
jgi:hypothetical protein